MERMISQDEIPTSTTFEEREKLLAKAMRQAQAGDAGAYRELLQSVRVLLMVYTSRVLSRMGIQDPALVDDLVQEVLLAIHEKRHTYDAAQPFTPWLFAIARYKIIDSARSRRRRHTVFSALPHPDEDWQMESFLEAPVFTDPTTAADLDSLLSTLPERSRRALELVKLEGLSVAEAAARLKSSESALKVTVHRALKALRSRVEVP
jgi:RNA polymerase sigma-70 factor (ECF subfamily)